MMQLSNEFMVTLNSPTVWRAILEDLHSKRDLTGNVKQLMEAIEQAEQQTPDLLAGASLVINLGAAVSRTNKFEYEQWRQSVMKLCLLRKAHYPLMKRLFKATASEVKSIRMDLKLPVETRPKAVSDADAEKVLRAWSRINGQMQKQNIQREADCWLSLSDEFEHIGLNSLYCVIVREAMQ